MKTPTPILHFMRATCYAYTFDDSRVKAWVRPRLSGRVLNLFAGRNCFDEVDEIRVDSDPAMPKLQFCGTAENFLAAAREKFNTILWDPPWNQRKSKEFYEGRYVGCFTRLKDQVVATLAPGGAIVSAGYEVTNFGAKRGMVLEEVLVVDPCGEIRPFFISVERLVK